MTDKKAMQLRTINPDAAKAIHSIAGARDITTSEVVGSLVTLRARLLEDDFKTHRIEKLLDELSLDAVPA
tara:strand:+ start:119 stop:328 length:210 start_codon:yes stop_codon:yes gene_type:complete